MFGSEFQAGPAHQTSGFRAEDVKNGLKSQGILQDFFREAGRLLTKFWLLSSES